MEISIRCRSSLVKIATILSSLSAEKSLPLSISIIKGVSNSSLDILSEANAGMHMLNDYPDVMSIDEMCRALSIGKKTGYKLLQTGQIRFLKIGRAYRIPKINLLEYLQVIRPE